MISPPGVCEAMQRVQTRGFEKLAAAQPAAAQPAQQISKADMDYLSQFKESPYTKGFMANGVKELNALQHAAVMHNPSNRWDGPGDNAVSRFITSNTPLPTQQLPLGIRAYNVEATGNEWGDIASLPAKAALEGRPGLAAGLAGAPFMAAGAIAAPIVGGLIGAGGDAGFWGGATRGVGTAVGAGAGYLAGGALADYLGQLDSVLNMSPGTQGAITLASLLAPTAIGGYLGYKGGKRMTETDREREARLNN